MSGMGLRLRTLLLELIQCDAASGIGLEDLEIVRSHNDGCATLLGEAMQ